MPTLHIFIKLYRRFYLLWGNGAGVTNLRELLRSNKCKWIDRAPIQPLTAPSPSYETVVTYIASQFTYSVYPTQEHITEYLLSDDVRFAIIGKNSQPVYSMTLEYILTKIYDVLFYKLTITQEKLCTMFPGVYYNFSCRNTDETNTYNMFTRRTYNGMNYMERTNLLPFNRGDTATGQRDIHNRRIIQTPLQQVFHRTIGEAVSYRKPGVRNAYVLRQSRAHGTSAAHKGGLRNRKTHKKKRSNK